MFSKIFKKSNRYIDAAIATILMGTFYYAIVIASVVGLIIFFVEIPPSDVQSERIFQNDVHPIAQAIVTIVFFGSLYTIAWFKAGRKAWNRSSRDNILIQDLLDSNGISTYLRDRDRGQVVESTCNKT